jgi:hypothetical protein
MYILNTTLLQMFMFFSSRVNDPVCVCVQACCLRPSVFPFPFPFSFSLLGLYRTRHRASCVTTVVSCKYEKTRRKNKDEPKQRPSLMSRCLGDDAEVGVGKPVGVDMLEEPPERRGVGHIGQHRLTRRAGKHATNTATDVGDD